MSDLDQLREDIEVCSRAALTPASETSAAPALPGPAEDAPRPAAPCAGGGRIFHADWWEDRDEVADLFVWLTDYSVGVPIDKIGDFIRAPKKWSPEYKAMIAWEREQEAA